mgnify:CR=1 FL=1
MDLQSLMRQPIVNYGQEMQVMHAVEICAAKTTESRSVVLRYASTKDGILVQVAHVNAACSGSGTNLFVGSIGDTELRSVAARVGMEPGVLLQAITDNVPKVVSVQA